MTENIKKEIDLKFRLQINKRLYEDNEIGLELYQKMENYLITKLNKLNGNNLTK